MQRSIVGAIAALMLAGFAATTAHAGVPIQISHQGRLLDASSHPVNGPVDLTFRIYDAPTGGAPLWTELQSSVAVTNGLFTVMLGSVTPLSLDVLAPAGSDGMIPIDRFLEVQVASDPPLAPRVRLGSAPYSVATGRVEGDIETQPNSLRVRDNSHTSEVNVKALDGNPQMRLTQAGVDVATLTADADSSSMEVTSHRFGRPAINTARAVSGGRGALVQVTGDDDGDGTAERGLIAGTTSVAGPPPSHLRGWDFTLDHKSQFELAASDSSSSFDLDAKPNPQATRDNHLQGAADIIVARMVASHNESDASDSVTIQASRKHGQITCADFKIDGSRRAGIASDSAGANAFVNVDSDGDGVPDNSVAQMSDASSARLAIKTKGTGAQRYGVNVGAATDSSVLENGSDEDGDGRENSVFSSVSNVLKCSASCLFDLDDDGVADNTVAQTSDAAGARLAIKTKGTGAQRQSATLDAVGDGGVTFDLSSDSGGIGGRSGSQHHYVNLRQAVSSLASDIDGDGTADHTVTESTDDSSSSVVLTCAFHNGPRQTVSQDGTFSHGSSRCATDVDHDGTDDFSAECYSDTAQAFQEVSAGTPGLGSTASLHATLIGSELNLTDDGITTYKASSNGNVYNSGNLGIGTAPGSHRIDVAGGAYCDGTNWVNASDVNSKENFQAIDGGQLLDQLMQLRITRWNYKGQTAAEHIGPTAQDFRATFGVGTDNKSISTIDPSGIALAAIKELNRQNLALQNQNQALKSELDELKQKVDALLSRQ
jgi:hypothetical protein